MPVYVEGDIRIMSKREEDILVLWLVSSITVSLLSIIAMIGRVQYLNRTGQQYQVERTRD